MPASRRLVVLLLVVLLGTVSLSTGASASSSVTGDPKLVKRIVSRVSDYPAGWALDPTSKPSDSGCFSTPATAHTPTARAQASPDFINNTTQERSGASAWLFASTPRAIGALASMTATGPLSCYRATIKAALEKAGLTVTSYTSKPLTLAPLGASSRGFRLTVGVRKGSDKAALIVDLLFAQQRRAIVSVGFNAQSALPSVADERATVAKSLARVPG